MGGHCDAYHIETGAARDARDLECSSLRLHGASECPHAAAKRPGRKFGGHCGGVRCFAQE